MNCIKVVKDKYLYFSQRKKKENTYKIPLSVLALMLIIISVLAKTFYIGASLILS